MLQGDTVHRKIEIALSGIAAVLATSGAALAGPAAVTAVPEPTSLSLMAAGIGVVAAVRYLRRK
jgi:PEP-CTERM motif